MTGGGRILLAHGGGGVLSRRLVEEEFVPAFDNPMLRNLDDAARLDGGIAITTDAYVVSPPFFPGGDIGRLAVAGTVNDLAVSGAEPQYVACTFVLEEGLPLEELRTVVRSMADTAREAGVAIVAGDTKVVERGAADRLFVTTTGIGRMRELPAAWGHPLPGDAVLVNGNLGDHGFTILAAREGLSFDHPLTSDAAPLNGLIGALFEEAVEVRLMRDLTRGGLGGILNELAEDRPWGFTIDEQAVPLSPAVRSFSELLGIDPLLTANEGKLVSVVAAEHADRALTVMRDHPYGRAAAKIGRVTDDHAGVVVLRTAFGSRRVLEAPSGEQLPRIC